MIPCPATGTVVLRPCEGAPGGAKTPRGHPDAVASAAERTARAACFVRGERVGPQVDDAVVVGLGDAVRPDADRVQPVDGAAAPNASRLHIRTLRTGGCVSRLTPQQNLEKKFLVK